MGMLVAAALSLGAGCRAPLRDIQVVLERHQNALAKLPAQKTPRLMYHSAVVTGEDAEESLPEGVLSMQTARAIAFK